MSDCSEIEVHLHNIIYTVTIHKITNLEDIILSSQCKFLSSQDKVNWWKRVNLAAVNHILKFK